MQPDVATPGGRVCVIGAGASGLPVVKALRERGIAFDCFERSDRVGGLWVFRNRSGLSSIYRSLRTNTSTPRTAYADFPMPADYPDFPDHSQMASYLEGYADAFGLKERIAFNTTVVAARRDAEGWSIALDSGETRRYGALVVASGHHWDPKWPEPPVPGAFDGRVLHARDYIGPEEPVGMAGKRVIVVGLGNSAIDIAEELSRPGIAEQVYLSARRGAWILPKRILGRPIDQLDVTQPLVPWQVQSLLTRLILKLFTPAPPWRYGLPRPDHPPLGAHPTISEHALERLRAGRILAKPALTHLEGRTARFSDGSAVEADVVLFCTGYRVSFPFFDTAFLSAPDNDLPLWQRMVRPGERDLFFVGLLQPLGALMPIAEAQARLIAACLAGAYDLPDRQTMQREMERERQQAAARYVRSARHTMEVDFDRYLFDLGRELEAGERRARRMETTIIGGGA